MKGLAVAAALAGLLGGASPARAAAGVVTAANFRYIPGDAHEKSDLPLRVFEGSTVVFFNADTLAPHTLTAVDAGPGGPLFDTGPDEVQAGQAAVVSGVESLPPGVYGFYCRLHTSVMAGELEVVAL